MRARIIKWLLARLGYPVHKLASAPSMHVLVVNGVVTFTTTQSPHRARALRLEAKARGDRAHMFLYRAYQELEP